MKPVRVHGGGAVFDRTSCSVGRRGQYGPAGIATLSGREGRNSRDDMKPSSSASQSERTEEQVGEVSLEDLSVARRNDGGFLLLDLLIACLKYFMDTKLPSFWTILFFFCLLASGASHFSCSLWEFEASRGRSCEDVLSYRIHLRKTRQYTQVS